MNKKISFLIYSMTSGGAERVLSRLLAELHRQKINIELICAEEDNFYEVPNDIKVTYLTNWTGNNNKVLKFMLFPFLAWKLSRYIKKEDVGLVQSHMFRSNYINILAKLFGSGHTVQIVDAISIDFFDKTSLYGKINLFLIKRLYKYADVIICKAEKMKSNLIDFIKTNQDIKVINNPYDINKIIKMKHEEIDDFVFNKEKKYIVTVGRISDQKNQKIIIDALKILDSNAELIIIGVGDRLKELQTYVKSISLEDRVHFLGRKKNPFKYIYQSDLFVLSSNQEGFPNVLIEGMLCKTAVISTDCNSGPREILAPESDIKRQLLSEMEMTEYGILFPVNDAIILANAIDKLLNSEELKSDFIEKAYQRANEFSIEKIIKKYKEVLCVE